MVSAEITTRNTHSRAGILAGAQAAGVGKALTWAYDPLPTQAAFHSDLRSHYKGFSGPVGSGKSYALAYEAIFLARMNPGLPGVIGAPTFTTLRDATQRIMFEVLEREGLGYTWHKSANRITLHDCRSDIIFRSLDNVERLRGPNLAWVGVDELTYAKPEAWTRLDARVRHPQANRRCMFGCWTPNGYDWVFKDFISKPKPGHHAHLASPRENHHVGSLYNRLEQTYDPRFYRQEALGEYLNVTAGQIYYAFDRKENVSKQGYDPAKPLCWALDFNLTPMSSVICQIEEVGRSWEPQGKILRVLDEISIEQSQIWEVCDRFHSKVEEWMRRASGLRIFIYGDATGNGGHHTGPSCYQAMRQWFAAHPEYRVEFRVGSKNPDIADRVNATNAMLCNYQRQRRCLIDPRCQRLIEDLEQTVWKVDSEKQPTGQESQAGGRSHMSSALGYLISREFGLHAKGGPRSGYVA